MKTLLAAGLVAVLTISFGLSTAEARRLGGGGSFGKQSQSARQAPAPKPAAAPQTAAGTSTGAAAKSASPWRGMLGGALLGLGLGALLSHLGLGGAMASMISSILMIALLALAAMFIYRMFKRKSGNAPVRPAFAGGALSSVDSTPAIGSRLASAQPAAFQGSALASGAAADDILGFGVPADFDVSGFVRHAKTYFIRLQAAWDRADINDIREFTTPEMFAEIRMQLQERGASANHTDVLSLDADLLGIETVGNDYLASVRFNGMIKESEQAPTEAFSEVWNLSKPVSGEGGWALAGIQQVN